MLMVQLNSFVFKKLLQNSCRWGGAVGLLSEGNNVLE